MDDAVSLVAHYGKGTKMVKVGLKSAFWMVPVCREDWELLGIHSEGQFYVDKCLRLGLRSSPFLFNQVANPLMWILHHRYKVESLLHYLNYFFLCGRPEATEYKENMDTMLAEFHHLGIPVAAGKLEEPGSEIAFLGIRIDTVKWQLHLPEEKLRELLCELSLWNSTRRRRIKKELLPLIGKLSFAAKVVPAGRLFLKHLTDLSTRVRRLHHRICFSAEARRDINWWIEFLPM